MPTYDPNLQQIIAVGGGLLVCNRTDSASEPVCVFYPAPTEDGGVGEELPFDPEDLPDPAPPNVIITDPSALDVSVFDGMRILSGEEQATPWKAGVVAYERALTVFRWSNLDSALPVPEDGIYASARLDESSYTAQLVVREFDFNVPQGAGILGIDVEITRKRFGGEITEEQVQYITCAYTPPEPEFAGFYSITAPLGSGRPGYETFEQVAVQDIVVSGSRLIISGRDNFSAFEADGTVVTTITYSDDGAIFRNATLPASITSGSSANTDVYTSAFVGEPNTAGTRITGVVFQFSTAFPIYSDDNGLTWLEGEVDATGHPDPFVPDDFIPAPARPVYVGNYWFVGPCEFSEYLHYSSDGINWTVPNAYTFDDVGFILAHKQIFHIPTLDRYLGFTDGARYIDYSGGPSSYAGGYFYANSTLTSFTVASTASGAALIDACGGSSGDSGGESLDGYYVLGGAWAGDRLVLIVTLDGTIPPAGIAVVSTEDGITWSVENNSNPFNFTSNVNATGEPSSGQENFSTPMYNRVWYVDEVLYVGIGNMFAPLAYYTSTDKGATWTQVNMQMVNGNELSYIPFDDGMAEIKPFGSNFVGRTWYDSTPSIYTSAPLPAPDVTFSGTPTLVPMNGGTGSDTITVSGVGTGWVIAAIILDWTGAASTPVDPDTYESIGTDFDASVTSPAGFTNSLMPSTRAHSPGRHVFQVENTQNLSASGDWEFDYTTFFSNGVDVTVTAQIIFYTSYP